MLDQLIDINDNIVQIGAYDGVSFDPLWPTLRKTPVRTLRVEPHPLHYAKLTALHSGDQHVMCVNAAIGIVDGHAPLYVVEPYKTMPYWAPAFSTVIEGAKSISRFAKHIGCINVRTIRYETLLRETLFPKPDVVVVDAEGYDLAIVEQVLNVSTPRVVMFEVNHLERGVECAVSLMRSWGYKVTRIGIDLICTRSSKSATRHRSPTRIRTSESHSRIRPKGR